MLPFLFANDVFWGMLFVEITRPQLGFQSFWVPWDGICTFLMELTPSVQRLGFQIFKLEPLSSKLMSLVMFPR